MADVDVPKVGPINKKVLIPVVVAAGGYIAYRYWTARQSVGSGDPATDPGMTDGGVLPGVAGAVSPDNSYGSGTGASGVDPSVGGFTGTSNSQWTDYVSTRLQQSDRWSYTTIVVALGNFIDNKPLSNDQQEIARAAIGLAGYPPVGSHTIVPGGNTAITVAPSGLHGTATATTIAVSFAPVAGAATYNGFRSNTTGTTGYAQASSSGSPLVFTGLTPGTSYSVQIAAVSSAGAVGPKSSPITVKTPGVKLAAPARPTVSGITASTAHLSVPPVPFATAYQWHVAGRLAATTPTPAWTATRMKSKTRYVTTVNAQTATGTSTASPALAFRTK
jgi:hypothetical protein